jgi:hypothetical protein
MVITDDVTQHMFRTERCVSYENALKVMKTEKRLTIAQAHEYSSPY